MIELMDRFLPEEHKIKDKTLNIIGATPLDFTSNTIDSFVSELREKGYSISAILSKDIDVLNWKGYEKFFLKYCNKRICH